MQVETVGEFGREITIPCNVHGVPRPNVTWFRNGKPLSETPNIRFSVGSKGDSNMSEKQINAQGQKRKTSSTTDLKINFLRLEDSGMFQCSASNAAGDLVGYTWLRVKSKYIQIVESCKYTFISITHCGNDQNKYISYILNFSIVSHNDQTTTKSNGVGW